jgi:hypothetical protein
MQGQAAALMARRQTPSLGMEIYPGCSRFCNGQSIQKPQGSTGNGMYALINSIKSTYFLSVSTDFHKRRDLLWDRWSHLRNYRKMNWLQRWLARDFVGFVVLRVSILRLCAGILKQITSDSLLGKHRIALQEFPKGSL